ncbi:MAG: fructuronate reductase [Alphaproteobacteria bacterium]|nr:MAG: fructuronate reductase [Caulobacteraceae bacterium]TPW08687.1 MAG: fructuronate reductase [Alphaproteobacteria bacterium]
MTISASLPALRAKTLATIDRRRVAVPPYALDSVSVGVAHIGLGAFHRAHQADYFDRLLARDPSWGICATSMNSSATAAGLHVQDGLYTLALLDEAPDYRVIGAIRETLPPRDPAFLARLAAPSTKLVTLTITEKGYCLTPDGELDFDHPGVRRDLSAAANGASTSASTAVGLLAHALQLRRRGGGVGIDVLSCDNLPANGDKLRAAVVSFADRGDRDLGRWIADEVRFPNAMVDAITPASDAALAEKVAAETGVCDAWPVQREAFASWVIGRDVSARFPDLEAVGVVMTSDVAAHERAKLRMLNGAHSVLAYVGLACGVTTVAQAMARPDIADFVGRTMAEEIAPCLATTHGLDLAVYRKSLLQRFANPSVAHHLSQIAWDGSQKLPIRLLGTITENQASGRPVGRLCFGVAAWMRFVVRMTRANSVLTDPLADELTRVARKRTSDAEADVRAFLALRQVFPEGLARSLRFQRGVEAGYRAVIDLERGATLRDFQEYTNPETYPEGREPT